MASSKKQEQLRQLPGVDHLLDRAGKDDRFSDIPRSLLVTSCRQTLEKMRTDIISGHHIETGIDQILDNVLLRSRKKAAAKLIPLINATGVVLHTNLGRALLCENALKNIREVSQHYSNLEFNLKTGKRGSRYDAVDELICELTGAEGAVVVNNNAGAVLLALNTLASGSQVVVSRGELVEIGGSFRIPDVMAKSGSILKEVGTTNRTHLRDYEQAVNQETGLFLKVHCSNYRIEGFTTSVPIGDLVALGRSCRIPVMEDLGSGTLIDFSQYGLPPEPTIMDTVQSGADIVTFSGDKLLGGPQAGIIAGRKDAIEQIKKNPMTRALRIDKMTLAALEATLMLYRDKTTAIAAIPTLRMLTMPFETICKKSDVLAKLLLNSIGQVAEIQQADMTSRPGGGSFPELKLPTRCVTVLPGTISVSRLERELRECSPPLIGRIEDNRFILDPRTIQDGQENIISTTLARVLLQK